MAERSIVAGAFLSGAAAGLGSALLAGVGPAGPPPAATDDASAADRQEILAHIDSIFRAYQAKDLATIRATHSADWRGFLSGSQSMLRGIDAYMQVAEQSVQSAVAGLGYVLHDVDVTVKGDVGIVYYLATYSVRTADGDRHVPLRSVDIYERRDGAWIQTGSNICSPPQHVLRGAALARPMSDAERAGLLSAREAVWRAWFAGDEPALRAALPDEAIAIDPGHAAWRSLEEIVSGAREFRASGASLVALDFPRTEIQAYGPVAIIYTEYALRARAASGEEWASAGRATEIFVNRDGRWLNSGWLLDRTPEPAR